MGKANQPQPHPHRRDHPHHDAPNVVKGNWLHTWTIIDDRTGETMATNLELTGRTPVLLRAASNPDRREIKNWRRACICAYLFPSAMVTDT
jgi:hypothetical protein